jgi:TRAP-type C4-dicarboxylate transport system substrate-binding protein
LAQPDGALARLEYDPNGVRVLFAVVMPPYQIFMQKPIEGVNSFEGQKLRTTSAAQDEILSRLKAVPVHITAPELYDSLSRGTVDGMVFPTASVVAYDVAHLVKFGTEGENFGSAVLTYLISNTRWRSLAPEIQAAMTQAGDETTKRICKYTDDEVQSDLAKIRAQGAVLTRLPADDSEKLSALTSSLAADWASQLDKRGRHGSEILNSFRDALK